MKTELVGYSGFVGSNLCSSFKFDGLYDSKNVIEAYGTNPDLLVYSGVPAQKFLANKEPEKDFEVIKGAISNIEKIKPKKIVLISTIDVYKETAGMDENTKIISEDLQAYGRNRFYLEQWIMDNFSDYLIVHLPGLYGKNIKKNFIYDLIHIIPTMLKEEKYKELVSKNDFIEEYYEKLDNGFYKCKELSIEDRRKVKEYFSNIGFSALNFTDSRGKYQFYNLAYLWKHIQYALDNNIKVLNLATEPISIRELYKYIKGKEFKNEITDNIPNYNFKTQYDNIYNGKNGYIFDKEFILEDIKKFVESEEIE